LSSKVFIETVILKTQTYRIRRRKSVCEKNLRRLS